MQPEPRLGWNTPALQLAERGFAQALTRAIGHLLHRKTVRKRNMSSRFMAEWYPKSQRNRSTRFNLLALCS